jgi:hypothetical protein
LGVKKGRRSLAAGKNDRIAYFSPESLLWGAFPRVIYARLAL